MNILLAEPYFTGSHAAWANGLARFSKHGFSLLTLAGRYWKWRMHGGAVSLAKKFANEGHRPDLILATDMLDLTTFLSLTRNRTAHIPTVLYMHENQLNYPWSPTDRDVLKKRDNHYSFINYASALAADAVCFNSNYHLSAFFDELPRFLKGFPDHRELGTVDQIRAKSRVLHLGLDLQRFDALRPKTAGSKNKPPLVLWNHRWEYDKNPQDFFEALYLLADEGLPFELAVLGERFGKQPEVFGQARNRLGNRIVQFGHVADFAEYAGWLWEADILPVTSNQDFFGISAVEAMYCGCQPILPNRLAFCEHLPAGMQKDCFYDDFEGLVGLLRKSLGQAKPHPPDGLGAHMAKYDWQQCIGSYDDYFSQIADKQRG